jgi:hypothetical protein
LPPQAHCKKFSEHRFIPIFLLALNGHIHKL